MANDGNGRVNRVLINLNVESLASNIKSNLAYKICFNEGDHLLPFFFVQKPKNCSKINAMTIFDSKIFSKSMF